MLTKKKLASKYDCIFENRLKFPPDMQSGYYKYIVFDTELSEETGQVFGDRDLGHHISKCNIDLPNCEWIVRHHKCVPIYFGYENADKDIEELKAILIKSRTNPIDSI